MNDRHLLRCAFILVALITLARLVIICITPAELVGDEAQYWDWSRRLALSYYSKGPGVAWTIAASTVLFGDVAWAVRLPAVVASAITLLSGLWLATMMRPSAPGKAALYATLALIAIPALHGASLLMTIDSPYVASWALACALAWALWRRIDTGRALTGHALALGLALGIAVLYKYTALILPLGMVAFLMMCRRAPWRAVAITTAAFVLCASPIIIWNAQHDWPTVRHLMGHLGMAGGDVPVSTAEPRDNAFPLWTLEYLGAQLGVIGPMLVLFILATIDAVRARRSDATEWAQGLFLMFAGWPIFVFYLVISFFTDTEANWPMAGAFTLAILASRAAERHMTAWRERVRAWRALPTPRPRAGVLLKRPESLWQVLWHTSIGFGIAALLVLGAAPWLAHAPGIGPLIPMGRASGGRELARAVDAVRATTPDAHIIATHYQTAARLAFYLPDHPSVSCASAFLGDRPSGYDHFEDTTLISTDRLGGMVILVGGRARKWDQGSLAFAQFRMVDEPNRIAIARFIGLKEAPSDAP